MTPSKASMPRLHIATTSRLRVFESVRAVLLSGHDIQSAAAQTFRDRQGNVQLHVETDGHVRPPEASKAYKFPALKGWANVGRRYATTEFHGRGALGADWQRPKNGGLR
jgi:hypothetical protein